MIRLSGNLEHWIFDDTQEIMVSWYVVMLKTRFLILLERQSKLFTGEMFQGLGFALK